MQRERAHYTPRRSRAWPVSLIALPSVADQRDISTFKNGQKRARVGFLRVSPAEGNQKTSALLEALFTLALGFVCRTR